MLIALLLSLCAWDDPAVARPSPEQLELVSDRYRDAARQFYAKAIDVGGLPVLASAAVADQALVRTHEIVLGMLGGRPDVLAAMAENRMYLIIIGKDQVYTDMPEYHDDPNPAYVNERVRGTGGRPTSFGEENLLSLPLDRYDDESIAVHEFCHTIDSTLRRLDPTWRDRLNQTYRAAIDAGLYANAYAAGNPGEYWAEIAQSYFDCNRVNNWNHGPVGNREQLAEYDPRGFALVHETFKLTPQTDWRYTWLQPLPNVIPPPEKFGLDPWYTQFTYAREFPVVGRNASTTALLHANDTIRKMFAYRHDILKSLINQKLKLVVLAPGETIADVPEFRASGLAGSLLRTHGYDASTLTLVVSETDVLANPADRLEVGNPVIRVMADASYRFTGTRPAEPERPRNDRNIQQYELRVKRLDVHFAQRLSTLFEAATKDGKWRGTRAGREPASYWCEGVLAYFDAAGQDAAPPDSPFPITRREQLAQYDPALFDLVRQTMAYEGHVDWRYRPAAAND